MERLGPVYDNTTNFINHTFQVTNVDYINGQYYYEARQWLDPEFIIPASATTKITNDDGLPQSSNFYVYINNIWGSTSTVLGLYSTKVDFSNMQNKIYHVKTTYHTFSNGTVYSLYTNHNKWMGYVRAVDVNKISKLQGSAHSTKQYVSLKSKNYTIWSDFNFKTVKHYSKNYYQKTYLVKTYYNHYNGNRYDSLYTASGKWFGYINASGVAAGKGAQGAAVSANKRVTVKSKNYNVFSNFNWKKTSKTSKLYNKKYTVKVIYHHVNGTVYYSLYSGSKWIGYVNAKAVR